MRRVVDLGLAVGVLYALGGEQCSALPGIIVVDRGAADSRAET